MSVYLRGVQYHLPDRVRTNDDLVAANPSWDAEKIYQKTGIRNRRIAAPDETAGDLAFRAARRLLDEAAVEPARIDALLFCTQSPDHPLPSTACLLQERLGLPTNCAAFDFNLGCSGFTYGLWLARALIRSGDASYVLLVVGDTYSRYCSLNDLTTVSIFGDGAGAALITADTDGALAEVGPSIVGTDGRGARNLIVPAGCARRPRDPATAEARDDSKGNSRSAEHLFMNGPEVFSFTLGAVQSAIRRLLDQSGLGWGDVDLFLFHQANRYMLEQLRARMKIPHEKMPIDLEDYGNTVGATLPILLRNCADQGVIIAGDRCVLAGFGVGYSWAVTAMTWGTPPGGGRLGRG